MKVKRIAYKKEPVLKVHRYIAVIISVGAAKTNWDYRYLVNLKEVNALKKKLLKGQVLEVYRASHNFIAAYVA